MITAAIERMNYLLDTVPDILRDMPDAVFSAMPGAMTWSRKEILGHLVDSATNNHHRFIRVRYEETPFITYDPDQWAKLNYYDHLGTEHLISFWTIYNRHLLELMKRITDAELDRKCDTGGNAPVTLGWLINDYVRHLEHHLSQITDN